MYHYYMYRYVYIHLRVFTYFLHSFTGKESLLMTELISHVKDEQRYMI